MTAVIELPRQECTSGAVVGATSSTFTWRPRHYAFVAGVAALFGLVRAEAPIETDVLWSARFGEHVLSTGHFYRVDTFSWSASGRPWIANSWLWDVVLGSAWQHGGIVSLWLVSLVVTALIGGTIALAAQRAGSRPAAVAMAICVVGLLCFQNAPRASALSVSFALVEVLLVTPLLTGSPHVARRTAASLIALQLLWINLHAEAPIGVGLVLVGGVATIVGQRLRFEECRAALIRLTLTVFGMVLACVATPYGFVLLTHSSEVRRASTGLIAEWLPVGFGSASQVAGLVAVLLSPLFVRSAWRGGRFASAAMLVVGAVGSATAVRFLPVLVVPAAVEIAVLLSRAPGRVRLVRRVLAIGLAAIAASSLSHVALLGQIGVADSSPTLVSEIPQGCRVVNDYVLGGTLILQRPDVKVSIDGRNDMYGRGLVIIMTELVKTGGPDAVATINRNAVGCVLAPTTAGLVRQLSVNPGWRVIGHDSVRTLLVRVNPAAHTMIHGA